MSGLVPAVILERRGPSADMSAVLWCAHRAKVAFKQAVFFQECAQGADCEDSLSNLIYVTCNLLSTLGRGQEAA